MRESRKRGPVARSFREIQAKLARLVLGLRKAQNRVQCQARLLEDTLNRA